MRQNLIKSHHASARMQQRCISQQALDLIDEFGISNYQSGAEIRYLTKSGRTKVMRAIGEALYRDIEKQLSGYFIETRSGLVLTVGHHHKSMKRKKCQKRAYNKGGRCPLG